MPNIYLGFSECLFAGQASRSQNRILLYLGFAKYLFAGQASPSPTEMRPNIFIWDLSNIFKKSKKLSFI
jgi:hypothetical protein